MDRSLATGGYDSSIKLWNVADGKSCGTLDGHNGAVFELAFRPDGKVLASASGDRTVKLWNVATGERLDTLKESQKELYTLAFSPDGTRLAAAGVDNRIRVWQITPEAKEGTNPLLVSKFAHETPVLRLVWSADGKTIVSCGEDRLVKVWNAEATDDPPDAREAARLGQRPGDRRDSEQLLVVGRIDGSLGVVSAGGRDCRERAAARAAGRSAAGSRLRPAAGARSACRKSPKSSRTIEPSRRRRFQCLASRRETSDSSGDSQKREDADLFRFDAKAGDQWIIETKAARSGSPLDTQDRSARRRRPAGAAAAPAGGAR